MRVLPLLSVCWCLVLAAPASGQAPQVDTIEPPSWWVGLQLNNVQLMLHGRNLNGIEAQFVDDRISVTAIHTVPNPNYAFVDVLIPGDLPAGDYSLRIVKAADTTLLAFPIHNREPSVGRYQGFSREDVVYLIAPDRFANGDPGNDRVAGMLDDFDPADASKRHGGDLAGIIQHLDYLQDLGVTALWLMPVLENNQPNSYHGYALTDYYRIDPRYGTNSDYRLLVEEAHRRGLKVIFDHVANHIGVRHPWIDDPPTADWTNGTKADHRSQKHYKLSPTDPNADPRSVELLRGFWFVDSMPDLNQRNAFLANYLIQNSIWWIEYSGIDGIREDTYPYADQEFMARWATSILHEYPSFNIVGEVWETSPAYLSMFQTKSKLPRAFETNLPSVMDFALSEALLGFLAGDGYLADVYKVIAQDFVYSDVDNLFTLIDNHDITRGLYQADGNVDRMKVALTILLTTRGIPQLLYGTEVAMAGGPSHVTLRANMPGGFSGDKRSVFLEAGRTKEENAMHAYVRSILALRRNHPALTRGKLIHYPPGHNGNEYMYLRVHDDETILVVANGYDDARTIDLSELAYRWPNGARLVDLMTGDKFVVDGKTGLPMNATSVRVLQVIQL